MRTLFHHIRISPWHRRLFYLLVLLLPLGGRLRFFRETSMLYGQFGEYIVPELYLTDIVIGLLLVSWFISWFRGRSREPVGPSTKLFYFCFGVLFSAGVLSLTGAILPWAGVYRLLKLLEWGALVWYIVASSWTRCDMAVIAGGLVAGGVGQSLLSWYQFTEQESLTSGFLAHAIGEQPISLGEQGISYVWTLGQRWVRPYGTFSHPNVLSGYLLMTLTAGLALWFEAQRRVSDRRSVLVLTAAVTVIAGGIGIALSRVIWFLAAASAVFIFVLFPSEISSYVRVHLVRRLRTSGFVLRVSAMAAGLSAVVLTAGGVYLMLIRIGTLWSSNQITVTGRILLNSFAMRMLELHPLGIGLGNFTALVRSYDSTGYFNTVIQPVHNVFLLVGGEMGIFALAAFAVMIGTVFYAVIRGMAVSHERRWTTIGLALFLMLACCCAVMFVDHYLWTIQQGQLIWWLVCAFCLKYSSLSGDPHASARTR